MATMSQQHASSLVLVVALLLLPGALWLERTQPNLWRERLWLPNLVPVVNKHTPLFSQGLFLPGIIASDLTLSPQDNPVIIHSATTVPAEVTLTIVPGTKIYVAEFGQLNIEGEMKAVGTADQPISFTTNEVYPLNRTWNGLVFRPQSTATLEHVNITAASPAVTCEKNSRARMRNVDIKEASLDIFSASSECLLTELEQHPDIADVTLSQ